MQDIKTKDVIAYATLPRIIPRAKTLIFSSFGYISFLMAHIYYMVRLLPKGHPYLQQNNIGRYGLRHVIVEAANNLKFKKENIDQIIIFASLLAGVAILFIQFALVIYTLCVKPVFAFSFMFDVDDPTNDVGFHILDQVFGIPDMFCSSSSGTCTSTNPLIVGTGTNSAFHNALHDLFQFYSTGLLLIGTLIFLYFIIVIVLETAVSGTPFGQRFQNVWVPVRLVVAIGLLLPLNYGLNSAQYITLYTAKYGASFATFGWVQFNTAIAMHPIFGVSTDPVDGRPIGEEYTMLAIPQQVDLTSLIASMSIIHACAFAYLRTEGVPAGSPQGGGGLPPHYIYGDYTTNARGYKIRPYFVKNKSDWMDNASLTFPVPITAAHRETRMWIPDATVPYTDAIAFYFGGDVIIRFGEYAVSPVTGQPVYDKYEGAVKPYCGDIRIPLTSLPTKAGDPSLLDDPDTYGGAIYMFRAYYRMILDMWFNDDNFKRFARSYVTYTVGDGDEYQRNMCGAGSATYSGCGSGNGFPVCAPPATCGVTPVNALFKTDRANFYRARVDTAIRLAWARYITASMDPNNMNDEIISCGWACAGAWFNKIAEINGMFMDGVRSIPSINKYPLVMEQVRTEKRKMDFNVLADEQFEPSVRAASGKEAPKLQIGEGAQGLEQIALPLAAVYKFWGADTLDQSQDDSRSTGNPFIDVMNFFFGTEGLINMRGANRHMHPLAQLVATGKSLVDKAIQNIGWSSAFAFAGGVMSSIQDPKLAAMANMGKGMEAISRMILSMAFIGLMAGFVLFYVLPFLPFIYFFFAVGTWVKTIFEAMVGTPLWALAHLRIDGEGLPGDAASNGYFLLLEIFIRPILTVFGLVAAITILAAQVHVLNIIWDLVVNNATGFMNNDILGDAGTPNPGANPLVTQGSQRPVMDQFFFMVIYTVICYMLALASFKLIDQIPNNMLRWAGAGVSAFGDMNGEQAEAVSGYISRGGMSIGADAADVIRSGAGGLGSGLGNAIQNLNKP